MLDQLKWYLVNVGIKKYAPVGVMAALSALGSLMLAHADLLESWGVNYVASWSLDWVNTHPITGPVILIELDTTSTAILALLVGAIAVMARAGEHHAMVNVPTTPPPPKV